MRTENLTTTSLGGKVRSEANCESVDVDTQGEDIVCSQQTIDQIESVQNSEKLREYHRKYSRKSTVKSKSNRAKDKSVPAVDFGEL